jgi:3-methyl-2-oxobutanoate hydroxymethyltransferase
MNEMIMLSSAVCRGAGHVFTVGDMPLGSYQASDKQAVKNANRFIKEAGCCAVKCEASINLLPRFKAIANAEVPVMGHIGLNPQKIHEMGGYRIQGKTVESSLALLETAKALEDAGAFALLLEGVTEEVAGLICKELKIPVYGIGSGRMVDGQLIVGPDLWNRLAWEGRDVARYIPEIRTRVSNCLVQEAMLDVFSQYVEGVKDRTLIQSHHVHSIDVEDFEKNANKLQDTRVFYILKNLKIQRTLVGAGV